MTPITIEINDEQLDNLRRWAGDLGVSIEEVIHKSIDSSLEHRKKFQEASNYVLSKNAELYRRLA
jgi:hypothetical protein